MIGSLQLRPVSITRSNRIQNFHAIAEQPKRSCAMADAACGINSGAPSERLASSMNRIAQLYRSAVAEHVEGDAGPVLQRREHLHRTRGVGELLTRDGGQDIAVLQAKLLKDRSGLNFAEPITVRAAVLEYRQCANLGEERRQVLHIAIDGR